MLTRDKNLNSKTRWKTNVSRSLWSEWLPRKRMHGDYMQAVRSRMRHSLSHGSINDVLVELAPLHDKTLLQMTAADEDYWHCFLQRRHNVFIMFMSVLLSWYLPHANIGAGPLHTYTATHGLITHSHGIARVL